MGKISAPVKNAPVAPPAVAKAKVEPIAKVAKVKAEKPAGEEGAEKAPRNRREKIDGDKKIKVIGSNTARVGSIRHGIVETIFAAKTVSEASQSTVTRKDGTEYKIGLPDIYFCLENNLIEVY